MKTLQDKQNAVLTLLEESILLTYQQKLDIVEMFPTLTEEQIDALGKFLATEEKIREEYGTDIQKGVEKILNEIVGENVTNPSVDNSVYIGTGKPS